MVLATKLFPWSYRAWHAGRSANDSHMGIEMTEPDCIKYTIRANFTCSDVAKDREQVKGTYNEGLRQNWKCL